MYDSFMKKLKLYLIIFLSTFSLTSSAAFTLQWSTIYVNDEDDSSNFSYNKMNNSVFLAASFDKSQKFYFGQHLLSFSREFQSGSETVSISTTELGPKFLYYFSQAKTVFVSGSWNPYTKGDRTSSSATEEISGSSIITSLGYHIKLSKKFLLGASVNYHALSISKVTEGSSETDVSQSYTSIYPMIELAFHFK